MNTELCLGPQGSAQVNAIAIQALKAPDFRPVAELQAQPNARWAPEAQVCACPSISLALAALVTKPAFIDPAFRPNLIAKPASMAPGGMLAPETCYSCPPNTKPDPQP